MHLEELRGAAARACLILAVIGPLALLGGCGGGSSGATANDSAETSIPESAPKLAQPPFLPPKKLVAKDLFKGTGTQAQKGDTVALQYNCLAWGSGAGYSNSWQYAKPPVFVLGERYRLQRGLNLAIPGMREGGGREVQVPGALLYYPGVPHPPVGRLDALLCKVYLVKVLKKKR